MSTANRPGSSNAKSATAGTEGGSPGQSIFHPDDGVDLRLVAVKCGTCGGPEYLRPSSRRDESIGGVSISGYAYRCSNPKCSAAATLRVPRGKKALPTSLRPPRAGEPAGEAQTYFHPDDGIDLTGVAVSCDTCSSGELFPRSKFLEELQSGKWVVYVYHHKEVCPVRLLLRVPCAEAREEPER